MSQHETFEKKSKRRSPFGTILLIVLLLLAGTVGYLYYSVVKAPLQTDDPEQLAGSVTMTPEERFRFFSGSGTVEVRMDAGDIWTLILTNTGMDFLDILNRELASYSLSVSGCAIHMDEQGLRLDLELIYKDTRLVTKVPFDLQVTGKCVSLTPAAVKLGVVPLPVEGMLSRLQVQFDLDLPVISDVREIRFEENALLLTGTPEEDIRTLAPSGENWYQAGVFSASLRSVGDALRSREGFDALLGRLEQEPGSVEAFYRNLFILAEPEVAEEYLDKRFGLTERFFPGIDFSALEAERTALREQLTPLTRSLEQFFTGVVSDYNNKKFRLSDGVFLINQKPFQARAYGAGKYDALFEVLDPDSFFLILVDAENGFIRKTSSFYRMADEKQQFTRSVDFNKTYILGCVFRGVDGEPFLLYEKEITQGNTYVRNVTLLPLTEADVSALQVPGKFGVWTDKNP